MTARPGRLLALAAVAAGAAVWLLIAAGEPGIPRGEDSGSDRREAEGAAMAAPPADVAGEQAARHELVVAESPAPAAPLAAGALPDHRALIHGRCIAAETGLPLAGCEVFLIAQTGGVISLDSPYGPTLARAPDPEFSRRDRVGPSVFEARHQFAPTAPLVYAALDRYFLTAGELAEFRSRSLYYRRRPNAVSGEDGRFAIRFQPDLGGSLAWWELEVASPHRCPRRSAPFENVAAGSGKERDLGDIRLHRGVRVQGHVRDAEGVPVVGAGIHLEALPIGLLKPEGSAFTMSDGEGRFAFEEPVPAGSFGLVVRAAGVRSFAPDHVVVGGRAVDLEVTVRREPSISGVVTDLAGHPVRRTSLWAVSADGVIRAKAITDDKGRFRLRPDQPDSPVVTLVTAYRAMEFATPASEVPWGVDNLRLTARETRPLELIVVNAVTGERVAGTLLVALAPVGPGSCADLIENDLVADDDVRDGRLVVEHVRSGPHRIRVKLNANSSLVPATLEVDLAYDGPRSFVVEMRPALPFTVAVSANGQPLPGAKIGMARSGAWKGDFPSWYGDESFLAHGETGHDGRAEICGAAAGMRVDLQVYRDDYEPVIVRDIRMSEAMPPVRTQLEPKR